MYAHLSMLAVTRFQPRCTTDCHIGAGQMRKLRQLKSDPHQASKF